MRTGRRGAATVVLVAALAGACTADGAGPAPATTTTGAPEGPAGSASAATTTPSETQGTEVATAAPRVCPEDGEGHGIADWVSLVQVGPRTMTEVDGPVEVDRGDLGAIVLHVECRIADVAGVEYTPKPGDATFLDVGTPVHAIDGIDPGFRVVADEGDRLRLFQVRRAPDADTGRDVFDVDGRVTRIEVTRRHVVDGEGPTVSITASGTVERLVDQLLSAAAAPERQPSTNEVTIRAVMHLEAGAPVRLLLYPQDDLLTHPPLTVPRSFTAAIGDLAAGRP